MEGLRNFDDMTRFFLDVFEDGEKFEVEINKHIVYISWYERKKGITISQTRAMQYSCQEIAMEMFLRWRRALDTVDHDYCEYKEREQGRVY